MKNEIRVLKEEEKSLSSFYFVYKHDNGVFKVEVCSYGEVLHEMDLDEFRLFVGANVGVLLAKVEDKMIIFEDSKQNPIATLINIKSDK